MDKEALKIILLQFKETGDVSQAVEDIQGLYSQSVSDLLME